MTRTTWIGQQWAWLHCVPPAGGSLKQTLEDWLPAETDVAVASVVCLERSRASAAFRPGLLWATWQSCPEAAVGDTSQRAAQAPPGSVPSGPAGSSSPWLISVSLQSLLPVHRGSPGCPLEPLHPPLFRTPLT